MCAHWDEMKCLKWNGEKRWKKKTIECHKNVYFHFLNVLNLIFWKILCCLFWMMYVPTQRSCGSQEHSRTSSIFIFLLKNENKKKKHTERQKGKKRQQTRSHSIRLVIAGTLINMRRGKIIQKFVCTHSNHLMNIIKRQKWIDAI